ncbi:S1C family serine protease [Salinicoccus hispanicus]|uniref:Serine protease HtrA-like n=1 Tax=Salinicoccus hispanicus TaxID=157225 RepID=A0A6N8U5M4_9STAP|nr:S1C family serine protease [Salinicoccus hispanicus]MXQ50909.1 PDZ domain-containing protein [Salinicoccus hispanicus]
MERSQKHIIPKDQYRRNRRVFSDDGSKHADGPDQTPQDTTDAVSPERHDDTVQDPSMDDVDRAQAAESGNDRSRTDGSRDYGPGEAGYADNSAPASMGGATRNTSGRGPTDGNGGRGGRKKGGCLSSLLLPFLAGLIGALAMLLLFNLFDDNDSGGSGAQDPDDGISEENRQEIEDIKGQLQEQSGDENKQISDTTAAIQKAKQSVVSVINLQKAGQIVPGYQEMPDSEPEEAGTGSGVIYKLTEEDAFIVTNNHVVEGAEELQVNLENGDQIDAELIGTDVWTDLSVLRVDRGNIENAIDFGSSDQLLVGETAIAIGSPLGQAFSGSVSRGIISGLDRSVPVDIDGDGNYDWEASVLQTDAAINPGNSGGALVDQAGNLIGINSMKISMPTVEGIGFAIPVDEVEQIVSQLEENGEVQRPYLGVMLQDLYTVPAEVLVNQMNLPDDVNSGVIVSNVEDGTPAAEAGLDSLDVIVSLDGEPVQNMLELRKYLYYEKAQGETLEIEYYRNGELQTATATLE